MFDVYLHNIIDLPMNNRIYLHLNSTKHLSDPGKA